MVRLPDGEKIEDMCYRLYRHVTDGQTTDGQTEDGRTDRHLATP